MYLLYRIAILCTRVFVEFIKQTPAIRSSNHEKQTANDRVVHKYERMNVVSITQSKYVLFANTRKYTNIKQKYIIKEVDIVAFIVNIPYRISRFSKIDSIDETFRNARVLSSPLYDYISTLIKYLLFGNTFIILYG